jgi:uncharacterized protein YndB with AHSA1/START domain
MQLTAQQTAIHLERIIPAPPDRVYRAWLDPALVARWMNPGTMKVTRAEVDERVGGHYRIWHADGSGAEIGGFDGQLAELVPGERIVFQWGFVGPDRRDGPVFDSVLTVTLREAPGGATHLTLVHERLDELAAGLPGVADKVGIGWDDTLTKLTGLLSHQPARPAEPDIADLSLPEAGELLRRQSLARLAYNGLDGFPRVIPIGFLWRDGRIFVCTAPTAPKVRALAARPRVALTIDTEQGTGSTALLVRGVATIEIVDGVPDEYLDSSSKTMPAEQREQFEAQVRALYRQMARISIEPRWARYFDFGAGRLPEFLRQLVAGG